MNNIDTFFRNRIGFPRDEKVTIGNLDKVLEKTALSLPFENLRIIDGRSEKLTEENLLKKIFQYNEGGLCYELNPILYLFLAENGLNVSMVRGTTFNQEQKRWNRLRGTHVANLLEYNGRHYLVDCGYGGNLPLKPVPLNGETVSSKVGEFRVGKLDSEYGDYVLYMKRKYKDDDWTIGYAFNTKERISNISQLQEVQRLIEEHEESPFNKTPLIVKLTDKGSMTLTKTSYTEWADGKMKKEEINEQQFYKIKEEIFN